MAQARLDLLAGGAGTRDASHLSQQLQIKKQRQIWTKDLSYKVMTRGEVTNIDSINQSIELILTTVPGERLFRPQFGSRFPLRIFDNMDSKFRSKIYNDLVVAIERWERRITLIKSGIKIQLEPNTHKVRIEIPYRINKTNIEGKFVKDVKQ